jgi:hypothetical protein
MELARRVGEVALGAGGKAGARPPPLSPLAAHCAVGSGRMRDSGGRELRADWRAACRGCAARRSLAAKRDCAAERVIERRRGMQGGR